jgi:hypothetical protein
MIKLGLCRLTERTLAVTLALLFVTPLLLTVIRNLPIKAKLGCCLDLAWIGRHKLGGFTPPVPDVPLTWASLANAEFQKRKTLQFNENFAGRTALTRLTDELWFRLFHDTANASAIIAVGEHDTLFEKGYLHEYFLDRNNKAALEPWVKDLRRLQDFCRSIGMGFVIVLVPSKASIYPEETPLAWRRWYNPEPRVQVLLPELFRENGIVFVNGVELMAREKLKHPPAPLFPKGGSHWSRRGALVAANAIQAHFAEQNKPAEQIQSLESTVTNEPLGDEQDLVHLMNLARPWKYPVERITLEPSTRSETDRMNLVIVGDSFTWALQRVFDESKQYSNISFWFYYKLYKTSITNGEPARIRETALPVDFSREVFAADCLLLVINEASAISPEHHLSAFIKDALAHLPDPAAPKAPFRAD